MSYDNEWYLSDLSEDIFDHCIFNERLRYQLEWICISDALYLLIEKFHAQVKRLRIQRENKVNTLLYSNSHREVKELAPETIFHAQDLFERFVSGHKLDDLQQWIAASGAIMIAAKFEDKDNIPYMGHLHQCILDQFPSSGMPKQMIDEYERKILLALNWVIAAPILPLFVPYFIKCSLDAEASWHARSAKDAIFHYLQSDAAPPTPEPSLDQEAFVSKQLQQGHVTLCNELMMIILQLKPIGVIQNLLPLPSQQAALCVFAARHLLRLQPSWPDPLPGRTRVTSTDLFVCASRLLTSFAEKFSSNFDFRNAVSSKLQLVLPILPLCMDNNYVVQPGYYFEQTQEIPLCVMTPVPESETLIQPLMATDRYGSCRPISQNATNLLNSPTSVLYNNQLGMSRATLGMTGQNASVGPNFCSTSSGRATQSTGMMNDLSNYILFNPTTNFSSYGGGRLLQHPNQSSDDAVFLSQEDPVLNSAFVADRSSASVGSLNDSFSSISGLCDPSIASVGALFPVVEPNLPMTAVDPVFTGFVDNRFTAVTSSANVHNQTKGQLGVPAHEFTANPAPGHVNVYPVVVVPSFHHHQQHQSTQRSVPTSLYYVDGHHNFEVPTSRCIIDAAIATSMRNNNFDIAMRQQHRMNLQYQGDKQRPVRPQPRYAAASGNPVERWSQPYSTRPPNRSSLPTDHFYYAAPMVSQRVTSNDYSQRCNPTGQSRLESYDHQQQFAPRSIALSIERPGGSDFDGYEPDSSRVVINTRRLKKVVSRSTSRSKETLSDTLESKNQGTKRRKSAKISSAQVSYNLAKTQKLLNSYREADLSVDGF